MEDAEIARRALIVAQAYEWVGTPYRHQASAIGRGADCLGLVRGVWRAVCGAEPEALPPYRPDWDWGPGEPMLAAAGRWLVPQSGAPVAGDVILFRMVRDGPAKHCGIYVGEDRFVHAYSGRAVTAAWLSRWWRARLAGTFAFPGARSGLPSPACGRGDGGGGDRCRDPRR